ncbi:MAG: 1-acyl-sn-glycerol-3-phosphate acyltransferase [Flavobacteriales bacterium]|nr:1-acyl-sn-glycerol-3-phosphate acyltransferase [Flavobacteriales bacterium]
MARNVFGQSIFLKRNIIRVFGSLSYPGFNWSNTSVVQGAEQLPDFPEKNVLFVSNHQTYFADVTFMLHVIHSALNGHPNNVRKPGFLRPKKHNIYYVAAEETMKSGFLPRLLALSGAVTVKRTWRKDGEPVKRDVDLKDVDQVLTALGDGWVISFPQGTTSPFVQGRKGTAHMVKQQRPVVVPVVIDGFRRAFDKSGLKQKKKGVTLKLTIKAPLELNYEAPVEDVLDRIMEAIEQTDSHNFFAEEGEK